MKKSMVAGIALVAGLAVAAPITAHSADNPAQSGQSTPATPPGGGMPGGAMPGAGTMGGPMGGAMGGMANHPGMGMGQHGPTGGPMREMMMRRMMSNASPQQRCEDRIARRAALITYTVTRLNLTAEQRPLWDKLNAILQNGTEKQQQLCAALKTTPTSQPTILDRAGWLEQSLQARLQSLQQARPALEQLYQKLSPEQKAIIDQHMRG